ncbi:hypothetical protein SSV2p16 [Sulfolobus spindle-shaped virus 2]|uniref:Fuselloviral protein SSV2p16 n=2 Tax=root TaxID=1 RepID=A0A157SZ08_SACSO|nr:hypothetical protein [Saccharolobus solfataricus]NP_944468.1 hypothetical protein SSV2p16 [Sulfolobus spindle-shaped virus 2]AAQ73263.1 ORF 96 [Sulfolobus spindle-shaped virus 2]SAI84249.1 Fuselloviral protein SSV2p16 [Saccharolobus solfataricus]
MEPQEEKEVLVSQSSIYFLLTEGRKTYGKYLNLKIEINDNDRIEKKFFFTEKPALKEVLLKIKRLYEVYEDSESQTQEAIRKEVLLEIAKLMYLFG